jgi:rubrerythrin
MAVWKCGSCGFERDAKCKPQKCPQCQAKGEFTKA